MKRQIAVRQDLGAKKVAVFSDSSLRMVASYLKPGEKLKYDDKDVKHYYLDKFGVVPYRRVYVNGQEGYILASAIEVDPDTIINEEVRQNGRNNSSYNKKKHERHNARKP